MVIFFFYKFRFFVSKSTLTPRYETEKLLELLSKIIDCIFFKNIIDLGSGSGVIGLSLAKEFSESNILLVDNCKNSLELINKNIKSLSINNSFFLLSDWFKKISNEKSFDLIVSNPPYLSKEDIIFFKDSNKNEPIFSLYSNDNGFGDLFKIVRRSFVYLNNSGIIVLEHGYSQAKIVRNFLILSGFLNVQTYFDNILLSRITVGEK